MIVRMDQRVEEPKATDCDGLTGINSSSWFIRTISANMISANRWLGLNSALHMHKDAPYKISSVDSAFARKLLAAGAGLRLRKSISLY